MKKLFALVALVLGVVSCQKDHAGMDVNMGGEQEVMINVSLPEETRANSADGGITNVIASNDYTIRYIFQVYNANKTEWKAPVYQYTDAKTASFPVRLVPGRDYRFVVWADIVKENTKADLHYNTADFPKIYLNATWVAMDETRDAYTVSEEVKEFNSAKSISLTLKRPLAKLRVITTDMAELLGLTPESATVTYSTSHYNTFDALNSVVGDSKISGCEHANYTIKGDYETTNGKVLFTDYFFAKDEVVKFNMDVMMSDNNTVNRSFTTDIPVKRNYLTTIKGDILTDGNNIVVNVVEGFAGEYTQGENVDTTNSFAALLKDAEQSEEATIELSGDITWATGAGIGSTPWISENAKTQVLTVNANGHKITATGAGVGAIRMANGGKLVINNATIVDESVSYAENSWEYGYLEFEGELEFNNCVFVNAVQFDDANVTFNECSFNSNDDNQYAAWICGDKAYFNACAFEGPRAIKVHEAYGSEVEEVVVDGCTFANISKKPGMAIGDVNAETTIVIKNSEFISCQAGDQGLYIYETDTDKNTFNFIEQNNTVATSVNSSNDIAEQLNNGETTIYLNEGDFVIPAAAKGKTVAFVGLGNPEDTKVAVTKIGNGGENCDYSLDGSTVTFENITITTNSSTYIGYARCNGTYKNCIINGTYTLYGNSVFEGCTFNVSGDVYNIWTWGAPKATFTDCTFNCDGKAMLLYGMINTELTMNNCVFNDNGTISDKAAIEVGNDYNTSYKLIVNNATVNGFDINPKGINTGSTLWANKNSMPADKLIVIIDGLTWAGEGLFVDAEGNPIVSSQSALAEAAKTASKVTLVDGNYEMPQVALQGKTLTIKGSKDVVIDASKIDARNQFVTSATLAFEGVTINFGKTNYMGFANTASLTYKDCAINGLQFLFGENVKFENCDFNSNGAEHSVWTYGARNVAFTGCDFTYGDRCVNCYSDNDVVGGKQTVNFTNCTFATENTASEGAVEINSCFFSVGIEVNLEGCTAPAYGDMAFVSRWDSTNGAKTTININ